MALRQLKPLIPKPIWNGVRRATVYVRRLFIWRSVQKHISGVAVKDQDILDRSARRSITASFKQLDDWMDPQLLEDADVHVSGVGQFHVRAVADDLYHLLPSREPGILRAIQRLSEGDVFIDAGANIGFYSIAAARKVGDAGRVIAIEMMPDTAEVLRKHVALNGLENVDVVERALSDHSCDLLEAAVPVGKFGQASIIPRRHHPGDKLFTVKVPTATLDELVSERGFQIALMKLDLEGAELNALKGATATLKTVRAVIFEHLDQCPSVRLLLENAGFQVRRLDRNNFLAERQ